MITLTAHVSVNQSRVCFCVITSQPITRRRPETGHPRRKPGKHGDAPERVRRLEIRALLTRQNNLLLACYNVVGLAAASTLTAF